MRSPFRVRGPAYHKGGGLGMDWLRFFYLIFPAGFGVGTFMLAWGFSKVLPFRLMPSIVASSRVVSIGAGEYLMFTERWLSWLGLNIGGHILRGSTVYKGEELMVSLQVAMFGHHMGYVMGTGKKIYTGRDAPDPSLLECKHRIQNAPLDHTPNVRSVNLRPPGISFDEGGFKILGPRLHFVQDLGEHDALFLWGADRDIPFRLLPGFVVYNNLALLSGDLDGDCTLRMTSGQWFSWLGFNIGGYVLQDFRGEV